MNPPTWPPPTPSVHPGRDIVLRLHTHKLQACAIDISMVGPPATAGHQCPPTTKDKNKSASTHPTKRNGTPSLYPKLHKHRVMSELHHNHISMIPAGHCGAFLG
eukprot:scaffold76538_cov62-Attheya_sp.AAC.5